MVHATVSVEVETVAASGIVARDFLARVDPARLGWCDHQHKIDYQDVQAYCRALSGAQFLSAVYGDDWRTKVNADTLDVDNDFCCLIGQLGGNESFEVTMASLDLLPEDCLRLGFFADDGIRRPDDVDRLNTQWRRLVTAT
jgi:hypothetical protein